MTRTVGVSKSCSTGLSRWPRRANKPWWLLKLMRRRKPKQHEDCRPITKGIQGQTRALMQLPRPLSLEPSCRDFFFLFFFCSIWRALRVLRVHIPSSLPIPSSSTVVLVPSCFDDSAGDEGTSMEPDRTLSFSCFLRPSLTLLPLTPLFHLHAGGRQPSSSLHLLVYIFFLFLCLGGHMRSRRPAFCMMDN